MRLIGGLVAGVMGVLTLVAPSGHGPLASMSAAAAADRGVVQPSNSEPSRTTGSSSDGQSGRRHEVHPGDLVAIRRIGAPDSMSVAAAEAMRRRAARGDRIVVPALDASMPLVSSPTKRGRLTTPPGVTAVGWATSTVRPGAHHGVSMLSTHRDTAGGGRGIRSPLYRVGTLKRGAMIRVVRGDTATLYSVQRVTYHPKSRLPAALMSRSGPHRIALVTCGGRLRVGSDGVARWSKRLIAWARATR